MKTRQKQVVGVVIIVGFAAVWDKSLGAGVGTCKRASRLACDTAYLDCQLSQPATDQAAICGCAAIYYGVCLPTAGCAAADEMTSCIDELMRWDCPEMSVCGNDCTVDDGKPELPENSILLPVNNFGSNYLQLSVCSKGLSETKLRKFGQVSMGRCGDGDGDNFRTCDLWVAPHTLTAVAFPGDVTYIRVERCMLTSSSSSSSSSLSSMSSEDDGRSSSSSSSSSGGGGGGSEGEQEIGECLSSETPVEYYGTRLLWPSAIDVEYSTATLCEKDEHCPGSFCDLQQQPRTCAPKLGDHFNRSGSHFMDPRWELLDL